MQKRFGIVSGSGPIPHPWHVVVPLSISIGIGIWKSSLGKWTGRASANPELPFPLPPHPTPFQFPRRHRLLPWVRSDFARGQLCGQVGWAQRGAGARPMCPLSIPHSHLPVFTTAMNGICPATTNSTGPQTEAKSVLHRSPTTRSVVWSVQCQTGRHLRPPVICVPIKFRTPEAILA